MEKTLIFLILLVLVYGIYNAQYAKNHKNTHSEKCPVCRIEAAKLAELEKELSRINTVQYPKKYIINVIDHGSNSLGFRGGVMEGGYALKGDSEKIACYVLSLSSKQCEKPYPEDAPMFFTSICGGCHGDDGKGLGGIYPDLTRDKLLGIQKKEMYLKEKIKKLKNQKEHH